MARRVKLIFNPHSDRGRSWDKAATIQPILNRWGGGAWSSTEYPTHATELAEQAAREGYDVVAAIGGDGTVHEVVNGLMRVPRDQRPLLGVVPIGSGNDFGSSIGILANTEAAMERIFTGEPRTIDIGEIRDGSGRIEYWDNTLGVGFDATVTIYSYQITIVQGFIMYLWAVIQTIFRKLDAPKMQFKSDSEEFADEVLMFVACNGPREGGGFFVAPEAVPDDGILHYAMIKKVSKAKMFRLIPEVMNGTHPRFDDVKMGAFKELSLISEKPLTIHMDGEIFAGFTSDVTEAHLRVLPGELQVIT
jgi:YegS/Rv2252/BmrU family lipid kinase